MADLPRSADQGTPGTSVSAESEVAAACRQGTTSRADRATLLTYLLRRQLGRILRLVDLEVAGEPVRAQSFARAGPGRSAVEPGPDESLARQGRRIQYEALLSYSRHEPRFELIHHGLQRALQIGVCCGPEGTLAVDGFRLILPQWAHCPTATLAENVDALSSYCDCGCAFCLQKGTHRIGLALRRGNLTLREVNTRIRYYSAQQGTGLPIGTRVSLEPFANPHCLGILERLHEAAPTEFTDITTNGACLTEDVIARLSHLRPILVVVSLNAATVEMRRQAMRDRRPHGPETALASPALLRKYEIPFAVSYVPWPPQPLSELEEVARLADRYDAVMVRVNLPSWSRHAFEEPPFDTPQCWGEILRLIQRLREEVDVPIQADPDMYEVRTMRPLVRGTIKHSPAAQAGFKCGDLILAMEGEAVLTRPEVVRWVTARFADPDVCSTRFTVQRGGEQVEIEVPHPQDLETLPYPYRYLAQRGTLRLWSGTLGLYLPDGPELTDFIRLKRTVEECAGRRVLFFTSALMEPQLHEGLAMLGDLAAFVNCAEFYVETAWPHFWGGNVMIGDLWTVQDLIEQTNSWIERQGVRPDVVIAPQTFLRRGARDVVGTSHLEFERALDIELRLLRCRSISYI